LVFEVDQWDSENKDGRSQNERPQWQVLDQYVTEEGGNECGNGRSEVLDEEDALEFEDEEVDELVKASEDAIYGLAWNGKVLVWAHLADEAVACESLSGEFSGRDGCEREVESLEDVSEKVNVVDGENEGHRSSKNDTACTRELPCEEIVEEVVERGERLVGLCGGITGVC
jgi:hypothetical protein